MIIQIELCISTMNLVFFQFKCQKNPSPKVALKNEVILNQQKITNLVLIL